MHKEQHRERQQLLHSSQGGDGATRACTNQQLRKSAFKSMLLTFSVPLNGAAAMCTRCGKYERELLL
jgi:hypothetical protein